MNDVRETFAFFSLIKQPLTALEIHRWKHGQRTTLSSTLETCVPYQADEGLYEVHTQWTARRITGDHARDFAWNRVDRFMTYIQANPFIKAVAVANSAAFNNLSNKSDVDLFIVTKRNRVWLARLCAALPAKIMRWRPGECERAPLCLSFFADEDHLNMESLTRSNDIYFAHWMDTLIWIHDPENVRERFTRENEWAKRILNRPLNESYKPYNVSWMAKVINVCLRVLDISWIERWAYHIQRRYLPEQLTASSRNPSGVVMNIHMIKMHLDDKREAIASSYERICASSD